MKAHDVRHLTICKHCDRLGDDRHLLKIEGDYYHDTCAVQMFGPDKILSLPAEIRNRVSIGAAGRELSLRLLELADAEAAGAVNTPDKSEQKNGIG